jgi:hypothetical protein
VYEYAHFLTGDDAAARGLQRAAFLDAHQALLLAGRLRNPRAWLLRAVRDTAEGDTSPAEELIVLRNTCGLRSADAAWVLGDDAVAARAGGRRGMRVVAGTGAAAAMAARASTAKALSAQVPGFTAASATGATHLIVASAVAGSALVGTAAITTKLEQRPHPAPPPITSRHTSPDPRPANPARGHTVDAAMHGKGFGTGAPLPGRGAGQGTGQGTGLGSGQAKGTGTGKGKGQGSGTGKGTGRGSGTGKPTGAGTGKTPGQGTGAGTGKPSGKHTPQGGGSKPPTHGTTPTPPPHPVKGKS